MGGESEVSLRVEKSGVSLGGESEVSLWMESQVSLWVESQG